MYTQTVPNLGRFGLRFFNFMMAQKQYALSRNCNLNFEFGSIPRLGIHTQYNVRPEPQPWQPRDHETKQPVPAAMLHPHSHSVFRFQCSSQYIT